MLQLNRCLLHCVLAPFIIAGCQSTGDNRISQGELSDLKNQVRHLEEQQTDLQRELVEIRSLLKGESSPGDAAKPAKPPDTPPLPLTMDVSESPFLGMPNAPVVLIEFTDYQCPFCRRHFETTYEQLINAYIETGKVKYVLKEFPLQKLHPLAPRAAMAAQCAGDQDRYWSMHDLLFRNQKQMQMDDLKSFAETLEMNPEKFLACMEKGQFAPKIRADFNLGVAAGVKGTPFFFLGTNHSTNRDQVTVERYLYGAQPFETFQQIIEGLLNPAAKKPDQ